MKLKEIVKKISAESGLEEKHIDEMIKKKQKELGGLITPEGAAHIVASDVGINLFESISGKAAELKVENIIPGMERVDIVGRVRRAYPPREFNKKDGSKGKVCSLVIGDDTGEIKVVFWGREIELIETGKIGEGDILRIKSGYTKGNINGEAEVHIGGKTRVIVNPSDVASAMPLHEDANKKISELKEGMMRVDVVCRILNIYEVREFEREDKTKGKVVNLAIGDETGRARLVLWDEDVALVEEEKIKAGDTIKVRRGYVKVRFGEPEVNVGRYGKIVLNPLEGEVEAQAFISFPRKRIEELKAGERAEVIGALVDFYEGIKIFDRKKGRGMVVNAVIDDGTGSMRAAFYDKTAELLLNIPIEKACTEDVSKLVSERRRELLGREIVAKVTVKHSDFSGKDELVVNELNLTPDPKEEAKLLLKKAKLLIEEDVSK